MESELLKIFDDQGIEMGTAFRSEVHQAGHWHETFHCWFIERDSRENYVLFQIRSAEKQDYPSLLDITAAGHLLADESALDGLREVQEELGIDLPIESLSPLGIIKDTLVSPNFIDRELCHVYLYKQHVPLNRYNLQEEEVSGIVRAKIGEFGELWTGEREEITVEGFQTGPAGRKEHRSMSVSKGNFVPHEDAYIKKVIKAMEQDLEEKI